MRPMLEIVKGGFSIIDMFVGADWVTKTVIVSLSIFSIFSWGLALNKIVFLRAQIRKVIFFEGVFLNGNKKRCLSLLGSKENNLLVSVFASGYKQMHDISANHKESALLAYDNKDIIFNTMRFRLCKEIDKLEKGIDWLATIATVSPFIGLFGTVWGIMNSFHSISSTTNVNFSVIAPGMSEALFATALGLFVAIPAVIFYNKISVIIDNVSERMDKFLPNLFYLLLGLKSEG
ncbi:MAG: tolQ [Candidatus Xenolissoclinum pacificiensis L6]|uniref:TolQ n=1 Tax=Candidatus Xenolissoclinum pacificiensis L6 TaxID=1401685 RepID=W2UY38_9RICK|nr:MAG: tolQ [Candidatus Xenolissoclinum pacificiensis L6]